MPVVINEFEVMAEAPGTQRNGSAQKAEQPAGEKPLDTCAVARAVREIEMRNLRTWAH